MRKGADSDRHSSITKFSNQTFGAPFLEISNSLYSIYVAFRWIGNASLVRLTFVVLTSLWISPESEGSLAVNAFIRDFSTEFLG
jgi:hypothetical protein